MVCCRTDKSFPKAMMNQVSDTFTQPGLNGATGYCHLMPARRYFCIGNITGFWWKLFLAYHAQMWYFPRPQDDCTVFMSGWRNATPCYPVSLLKLFCMSIIIPLIYSVYALTVNTGRYWITQCNVSVLNWLIVFICAKFWKQNKTNRDITMRGKTMKNRAVPR